MKPKKPTPSISKPVASDAMEAAREFASSKSSKWGSSGKVPSGDVRLTANVRKELHLRLKIESAKLRKPVGEIIEEWIKANTPELEGK